MIDLLKVISPIDGQVVAVRAHKGEAVQPTQPGVIHIVGLDKVWVEGQVKAADFAREQFEIGQPVTVEVVTKAPDVSVSGTTRTQKTTVSGKIKLISPLTETGGSYLVRAEVQSEKLHPGMTVEMVIPVKQ
jgi:multidrug resistance efflux pump